MKLIGRKKQDQSDKSTSVDVNSEVADSSKGKHDSSIIRKTVIVRPMVTEKAARLTGLGKYVFEVATDAGRVEIQQAITRIYGVRPVSVNVQNVSSKQVRFGRRGGTQKAWKKAIVTLAKGQKIDVHEGV